ncbi:PaaI family thioesterase [Plebeiibacterium marinum]|uniref:Acyl-coenzyme A thioesterase THEM4 n=1 Tax=Plebeiibacterium marinum TaxID=2992111 RepID=A0AAE3MHS3_9BACT|nr:PaaI family thioesterase [Plebeiobacterium marinum]MCW3807971.1 PaaI family thioesterase [Plebeiobacterium marinum]
MRKIVNPFVESKKHDYKCFGCSPLNEHGLQLEFWDAGEEVICKWIPKKHMEGYSNILHGGIQALILDEIASWTIYAKCETAGVTANLDIKYKNPLEITDKEITVRGKVENINRRLATITTSIENHEGKVCATGTVTYFIFPQDIAKEKYNYPGVEAFYE